MDLVGVVVRGLTRFTHTMVRCVFDCVAVLWDGSGGRVALGASWRVADGGSGKFLTNYLGELLWFDVLRA